MTLCVSVHSHPIEKILTSPHFPFYGNRGHHKSLIFFFFLLLLSLSGCFTTQTRPRHRWNMYQERWSCGLCSYSPSSRASLTNTSLQTGAGGRGLAEAAAIPLADGRCAAQERKLQEKERLGCLAHGVTGRGDPPAQKRELCMDMRIFSGENSPFLTGKKEF